VTIFFPTFFLTVIFEVLQEPLELTDSANPAFDFMVNLTVFFSAKFFGTVGDTWVFKEIIGTGVGVAEGVALGVGVAEGVALGVGVGVGVGGGVGAAKVRIAI